MKPFLCVILTILFASAVQPGLSQTTEMSLHTIFDGESLDGWDVPENNLWWHASDGILHVKSTPDQQGSILWTQHQYTNFILEFEFMMGEGTVDSGIFMRNEHDQIQIGESGSLKRDMTGSPYIPGKGYPKEAEGVAEILLPHEWNAMTIVAIESTYSIWLNGHHVNTYQSETAVAKGPLGIQLHPNRDMEIAFRNLKAASLSL